MFPAHFPIRRSDITRLLSLRRTTGGSSGALPVCSLGCFGFAPLICTASLRHPNLGATPPMSTTAKMPLHRENLPMPHHEGKESRLKFKNQSFRSGKNFEIIQPHGSLSGIAGFQGNLKNHLDFFPMLKSQYQYTEVNWLSFSTANYLIENLEASALPDLLHLPSGYFFFYLFLMWQKLSQVIVTLVIVTSD